MLPNKNLHSGHRQRLKRRFLSEGANSFEEHVLLELLLFYGIPMKDTNETAHMLIDRFGSIAGVLEADIEELTEIPEIGVHAATLLKVVHGIMHRREKPSETSKTPVCNTIVKLAEEILPLYKNASVELVHLTILDSSMRVIKHELMLEGSVNSAAITARSLAETGLAKGACTVVLSHNHPNGIAVPSFEDISTTKMIAELFDMIDVPLLEHIIVAGGTYLPLLRHLEGQYELCPDRTLLSGKVDMRKFYNTKQLCKPPDAQTNKTEPHETADEA
jgi:DNA repair protein RadC